MYTTLQVLVMSISSFPCTYTYSPGSDADGLMDAEKVTATSVQRKGDDKLAINTYKITIIKYQNKENYVNLQS